MNGSSGCKYMENPTQTEKVLASGYAYGTQITVIECGDLFKSYEVRAKGAYGFGFARTYKYKHQAFETFNTMCATIRLVALDFNK